MVSLTTYGPELPFAENLSCNRKAPPNHTSPRLCTDDEQQNRFDATQDMLAEGIDTTRKEVLCSIFKPCFETGRALLSI